LVDGSVDFLGRFDHQVKVRGFRIELGEIETVLATHPGVATNVVHVREDVAGDQRLVAYIVTTEGNAFDADQARATLRARLPEYMIPNQFVTLDALPLTPNGKVDRKALPIPAEPAGESVAFVPENMTPAQRQVATIWQDLLRVNNVGLHANFFDAGGHSLLLVRLQSALQQSFGKEIALIELFQHTTIAAQANRLGTTQISNVALDRAKARAARQAASLD
jgi:acyl carrier protein